MVHQAEKKKRAGAFACLFPFTRSIRVFFAIAFLFLVVSIAFQLLMPQVLRLTVDSVIGENPISLPSFLTNWIYDLGGRDFLRENLLLCASFVVLFALLSGIMNFIARAAMAKGTETMIERLRNTLYGHIQRLPFAWHTKTQTGDLIQRCTADVEVVRNFVASQLLEMIRTISLVIVALFLMFSMNVKLSLVALAFLPVIFLYSLIFSKKIAQRFRVADEAEGDLMVAVQENLTGVRVVRAFGRERYEEDRFDAKNQKFTSLWLKLGYVLGAYWGTGDWVTGIQVLTVLAAGTISAVHGEISVGEFLVFITYTQSLAWPVRSLGRVLAEMSKTKVSVLRLKEILDAEEEDMAEGGETPDMHCDIRFDNVSFYYNEAQVLKNLTFTIPKGKTVGILGSTGSGKSTLTYLLNRLYDLPENSGHIYFGKTDIKDISRAYLRRNVGLVLQQPFLFSKTIAENLSIAAPGTSFEEMRASAGIAAVDRSIMEFASGYDTIVGERGVTLSGGQKQRVAIARTLLTKTPILIFDDSMSAVDLETDEQIREALKQNTKDTTLLLISHRINTLMRADLIVVLHDGAITQLGTHQELIEQGGIYREVYELQGAAAGEGDVPCRQ